MVTFTEGKKLDSTLGYYTQAMKRSFSEDMVNYRTLSFLITAGKQDWAIDALKDVIHQHRFNNDIYEAINILIAKKNRILDPGKILFIKKAFLEYHSEAELVYFLKLVDQIVVIPEITDPDILKHDVFWQNIRFVLKNPSEYTNDVRSSLKEIDQRLVGRYSTQKSLTKEEEMRFYQAQAALRLLATPFYLNLNDKMEKLFKEEPNWRALFN